MPDEFLKVARQEIESELEKLELLVAQCSDDEHIFKSSQEIKEHVHRIRGLAPMMGQQDVGEIAKTCDDLLRYIVDKGPLSGSCSAITKMIGDMKKIFSGLGSYDVADFKKTMRERFPQVLGL